MSPGFGERRAWADMKVSQEQNPQASLVEATRRLALAGLHGDTTVSARAGGWVLMVAAGSAGESADPEDVVFIARDGGTKGRMAPPLDWSVHHAIYAVHADVQAVVHAQCTYATALACLERPLPAFHHRVAIAGGDSVPCVAYHEPGSATLAKAVVDALGRRHACLLAHDGLLATGASLSHAVSIAIELESLSRMYLAALPAGEPPRLERAEIARVLDTLQTYARAPWA